MECAECGFLFVETLPSDRRKHNRYHRNVFFGLRRVSLERIQPIWTLGARSIRIVDSRSPRGHRQVAQELSLVAAGDVEDQFSFVAYHRDEAPDERQCQIVIGADSDHAVSYLVLERRFHVWRCTWAEYDTKVTHSVSSKDGVWSVGFAWVSRANRRQGWLRRSLEASSEHLGFSLTDLGWYTPFSKDGEALARSICPMTLVIAK